MLFGSLDDAGLRARRPAAAVSVHRAVDYHVDKFAALHAACWSGGSLLYVPKGVVIEKPLHMLSALSPGGVDFGHTLIVLEEGAEATVLAETASIDADAAGLHCGAIEILVGPRAQTALRQPAELGHGRVALRPSEGARRSRRRAAVDHRRAGQPAGQGQSARRARRRRRQRRRSTA